MAITYPLSLPSEPQFNSFTLKRRSVTGISASPYTGEQYVYAYPGQWWEFDATLPPLTRAEAAPWRAFFAKLNGQEGTFLAGDPTAATPRGTASATPGTPVINGASQTGNEIDIDGLPTSETGYLLEGDFIQFGSGLTTTLHMVLEDVDTNGSGEATVVIWPDVRLSPGDGAAVVVSGAKGLFRLKDNITFDDARPFPFFETGFSAIEAL